MRERGGPRAAAGSIAFYSEFERERRGMVRVGFWFVLILPRDLSLDWFCLLLDGVLGFSDLLSWALWLRDIFRLFFGLGFGDVWLMIPVASLWWRRTFPGPEAPLEFDRP